MRYGLIVAAMLACGPAMAGDPDCGTNPNTAVGIECMVKKFGPFIPVLEQPSAYLSPTVVGIGLGALRYFRFGDHVVAVGRCAGASLTGGTNVILEGDFTAAPGPKARNFINWQNKTCLQDSVVVQCPPPEPECNK